MRTFLLCLSCVLFSSWTFSPATVKLEYVFKVGDEYTMDQSTKQLMKQTIMGTDQNGENEYSGTMLLKVVSLTSNGARVETQFLTLKNASKTIMGETVMDSEGAQDNTQNKIFKAMMKKPFHITMTKTGKVEKVEGAENLWADIGKLGIDEATINTIKPALNQMMSENSLRSSFEQALVTYPENKVQVGDTWNSTTGLPMGFPVEVANTWKLAEQTSTQAVVNSTGIFTTTDKAKTVDLPGGFRQPLI